MSRRRDRQVYIRDWAACVAALALGAIIAVGGPLVRAGEQAEPVIQPVEVDADHAERMAAGLEVFREHVKPIFLNTCIECHGDERIRGELDMVTREHLLLGGQNGPAVEPGDAEQSLLYQLVTHQREPHMPQRGDKLSDEAIDHIRQWIDLGAPFDQPLIDDPDRAQLDGPMQVTDSDRDYWAFRPLGDFEPPAVENDAWPTTDIDRFLLARMEAAGVTPNEPADRRRLIRRAYFGVTGLPPSPEQVEAFVNDDSPDAWQNVIDELLASPHYGERWAQHWLDIARFAESHGFEQDYNRPHAYHYRDFVIRALNQDMPYDQFVRWQLAGDEIAPDEPLAMMATGFLGAGVFPTQLTEREFESARYNEMDDMLSTTGVAMLGVTVGCARCHDHKYDPVPTADYYRMLSIFTTTIRSNIELDLEGGGEGSGEKTKVMVTSEGFDPIPHHADERGFPHFYEQTYFLSRGDLNQKQHVAEPGFLQVLTRHPEGDDAWLHEPPEDARTSHRRHGLADWITDVEHGAGHLLARVIVNRLWQHHMGRGIVATPNDFGLQGTPPTHPELLDFLAAELIRNDWQLKPIHRMILTSSAYKVDDAPASAAMQSDPDNELFWRWQRRRLESEPIRDNMLATAGLLDARMHGEGTLDESHNRRSIYYFIKRSQLIPFMTIFDRPDPLTSVAVRPTTTVAPQALLLMNNDEVRRIATAFADRVAADASDPQARIRRAYDLALQRQPSDSELAAAERFLQQQGEDYAARGLDDAALTDFCQLLLASNEFMYVD